MFGQAQIGGTGPGDTTELSLGACSPIIGPRSGGTTVTLYGMNFVSGCTVQFGHSEYGWNNATSVTLIDPTRMTCVSPASTSPYVDHIKVTAPDGSYSVQRWAFDRDSTGISVAAINPSTLRENLHLQDYAGAKGTVSAWAGTASALSGVSGTDNPTQTLGADRGTQNGHGYAKMNQGGVTGDIFFQASSSYGWDAIFGVSLPYGPSDQSLGYTYYTLFRPQTLKATNGGAGYYDAAIISNYGTGTATSISTSGAQSYQLDRNSPGYATQVNPPWVSTGPSTPLTVNQWVAITARWDGRALFNRTYNGTAQQGSSVPLFPDASYGDFGTAVAFGYATDATNASNNFSGDLAFIGGTDRVLSTTTMDGITTWMQNTWSVSIIGSYTAPASESWSSLSSSESVAASTTPATWSYAALGVSGNNGKKASTSTVLIASMSWSALSPSEQVVEQAAIYTETWSTFANGGTQSANLSPGSESWATLTPSATYSQFTVSTTPSSETWSSLTQTAAFNANVAPSAETWATLAPSEQVIGYEIPYAETWSTLAPSEQVASAAAPYTETWAVVTPSEAYAGSTTPAAGTWSTLGASESASANETPYSESWATLVTSESASANETPYSETWSTLATSESASANETPYSETWSLLATTAQKAYNTSPDALTWATLTPSEQVAYGLTPGSEAWSALATSEETDDNQASQTETWSALTPDQSHGNMFTPGMETWSTLASSESGTTSASPALSPWLSLQSVPSEVYSATASSESWSTLAPRQELDASTTLLAETWSTLTLIGQGTYNASPVANTWTEVFVTTQQAGSESVTPEMWSFITTASTKSVTGIETPYAETWSSLLTSESVNAASVLPFMTWAALQNSLNHDVVQDNQAPALELWSAVVQTESASSSALLSTWLSSAIAPTEAVLAKSILSSQSWAALAQTQASSLSTSADDSDVEWDDVHPVALIREATRLTVTVGFAKLEWETPDEAYYADDVGLTAALQARPQPAPLTWQQLTPSIPPPQAVDTGAPMFGGGGGGGGRVSRKDEARFDRMRPRPKPLQGDAPTEIPLGWEVLEGGKKKRRKPVLIPMRPAMRIVYDNEDLMAVAGIEREEPVIGTPSGFARGALAVGALALLGVAVFGEKLSLPTSWANSWGKRKSSRRKSA